MHVCQIQHDSSMGVKKTTTFNTELSGQLHGPYNWVKYSMSIMAKLKSWGKVMVDNRSKHHDFKDSHNPGRSTFIGHTQYIIILY